MWPGERMYLEREGYSKEEISVIEATTKENKREQKRTKDNRRGESGTKVMQHGERTRRHSS